MRHLVTGGAGFIGSHLCDRLLKDPKNEVICLDNLFTSRRTNIESLIHRDRFEFVRHDVCDPFHFEVDQIWHLACPASPVHYQRNSVRTIRTCVEGTTNALELARKVNARIFIASTSEVYGDPLEHPQKESYFGNVNTLGPRSCYDEGKRCAEALAFSYMQQYATDVRIARIFNCYGPRMAVDDGRVVSSFICAALRGEPLPIFGDGQQTRSFIFVENLVDGICRLMKLNHCSLPVNLGNPCEFTIKELAEEVRALFARMFRGDREVKFQYLALPKDDPTRRKPDITRAKELLDWDENLFRPLDEGLAITAEYFIRSGVKKEN